jgi:hypothetical protein
MLKRNLLSLFVYFSFLEAIQIPTHQYAAPRPNVQAPWFTGPLLAPSALTIPPGHYNIEPYLSVNAETGFYNQQWKRTKRETFWVNQLYCPFQFGINPWLDFQFTPTFSYNSTRGVGEWTWGDMPIAFDIQLFHTTRPINCWNTALKLTLRETIPLGKYQNLNPKKYLTDEGGLGSWQTGFGLVWGNIFYLGRNYFLTWRNAFLYTIPAPVRVKNLNAFGGGEGTKGTAYPAQSFQFDTAVEINLSQNWAFALDIVGNFSGKNRFKGRTIQKNTSPSSIQLSLAPAIEYNWSANIGIIFGSWFSVAGQNAVQFTSGLFAFNYYH